MALKLGTRRLLHQLLLLSHLLLHCYCKDEESMAGPNSLLMGGRFGPSAQRSPGAPFQLFLQGNHTEVEAQVGATAQLHCTLAGALADGMVSWVRRRDYHLLTVGRHVYTSDERVAVKVAPDASDWILTLRWVREADAGQYECQVSSHPPQALMINLKVKVAWAEIQGEAERFIHSGSALRLMCVLRDITEPPSYVFWFREGRMINYDTKAGVTVKTLKGSSVLFVKSVTRRDEGNYSCVASNTTPASVSVHVVQKENPAGLQQETNTEKEALSDTKPTGKASSQSFSSSSSNQPLQGKSSKSYQSPSQPPGGVVVSSGGSRLLPPLLAGARACEAAASLLLWRPLACGLQLLGATLWPVVGTDSGTQETHGQSAEKGPKTNLDGDVVHPQAPVSLNARRPRGWPEKVDSLLTSGGQSMREILNTVQRAAGHLYSYWQNVAIAVRNISAIAEWYISRFPIHIVCTNNYTSWTHGGGPRHEGVRCTLNIPRQISDRLCGGFTSVMVSCHIKVHHILAQNKNPKVQHEIFR